MQLDGSQFDQVVVIQGAGLVVDGGAVDHGEMLAIHVAEEVAQRPPGDHGHLHPRLAEGGEWLVQGDFMATLAAGDDFQHGGVGSGFDASYGADATVAAG